MALFGWFSFTRKLRLVIVVLLIGLVVQSLLTMTVRIQQVQFRTMPQVIRLDVMSPLPPAIPVQIIKYDPALCQTEGLTHIIYVHTAPSNRRRRDTVRKTWGNRYLFLDHRTRIVFLVGKPLEPVHQLIINEEHAKYGDIVQGDFIDNYKNMTLKAILGWKFLSTYCAHVPFAIKTDDDALVNIFDVMDYLMASDNPARNVVCFLNDHVPILRTNGPENCMKWCVDDDIFINETDYPHFCAGIGYALPVSVIKELYDLSHSTSYFWIDDVYTGFVMDKVKGVTYTDMRKIYPYLTIFGQVRFHEDSKKPNMIFSSFHRNDTAYFDLWKYILANQTIEVLSKEINSTVVSQYIDFGNSTVKVL